MKLDDILKEASNLGWYTIVTPSEVDKFYVDFQWPSQEGESFSFSAEWINGTPETLIEDIRNVENSFNLEHCLDEYLEGIRNLTPAKYFELSRKLNDVHT